MTSQLTVEQGEVSRWTLNRPQARNALSRSLMTELRDAAKALACDGTTRALILTGKGPTFCAGADLKERATMSDEDVLQFLDAFRELNAMLESAPFPVIAALNGTALGGGLELALACHLRICVAGAKLGLPEVSLGIIPGAGGTQRLSRAIGPSKALEWVVWGKVCSAQDALEAGLVHRLVPDHAALLAAARQAAEAQLKLSPTAVQIALETMRSGFLSLESRHLETERAGYIRSLANPDRSEALKAFQQKRAPHFEKRRLISNRATPPGVE